MNMRLLSAAASSLVLALSLSACSGGGGDVAPISPPPPSTPTTPPASPPPPAPPPPGTNFDTAEYEASNYDVAANAISAYNAGATGKGVKIGIVDSGINPNLSEFTGRIDPASGDATGSGRGVGDDGGHGTAVSAVAAAARNGQNTMGVAFNATIVSERADQPGSCGANDSCSFYDDAIANGIDTATRAGARVINLSLGGATPGPTLLSAMQRAVNAGVVIVIAAGNDATANPDPFALTPAQQFPGSVIIAGAIDSSGQIASFSDRAGSGAQYFLTAVGVDDQAPNQKGVQYIWSGTSFSAPTISGAVALLAQAFPNLTGKQIVDLLLRTATDLGTAGTDSTYGRGELDIARAFAPQGQTALASSKAPISLTSNGDLPAVAGDAKGGAALGAVILDGYSRAYVLNLAKTLRSAPADQHPLARALIGDVQAAGANAGPVSVAMTVSQRRDQSRGFALDRLGIGPDDARQARLIAGSAIARLDKKTAVAFGFSEGAKALERRLDGAESGAFLIAKDIAGEPGFAARRGSSIAVRRAFGRTGVTVSGETGTVWQDVRTSATGAPYRWTSVAVDHSFGPSWLSLGLSRLEEKESLLGGRLNDALGGGGASSLFLDAEARHDFGNGWSAGLMARHGWTSFAAGKFRTGAYAFDLTKAGVLGRSDRLGFRLAQPLRVESGGIGMMLPTSYDYATRTATDSFSMMSLKPSGRELDGELSYGANLFGNKAWLGGNLFYRRQPGHIASAPDDAGAALRFSLGF